MADFITMPTHTEKKKTDPLRNANSRLLMQGAGASEMRRGMAFFAPSGQAGLRVLPLGAASARV